MVIYLFATPLVVSDEDLELGIGDFRQRMYPIAHGLAAESPDPDSRLPIGLAEERSVTHFA